MQDGIDAKKIEKKENKVAFGKKIKSKNVLSILLLILLLGAGGSAVYFYNQYHKIKSDPVQAQNDKNKAETQRVLDKLKLVILITESEQPTVARVEDTVKLQESNKEFYKDVQRGDYLVIFPKRAIIYRENSNQIINVAPIINTSDVQKTTTQSGTQPASNTPATNSTSKTTR